MWTMGRMWIARSAVKHVVRLWRRPYWDRPNATYLVRRWPDLAATCVATVFFWLSLTPSLVPRPWFLQGVIGGITAAIGYAVGSVLSTLFRALIRRRPSRRTRTRCWQAYWVLSPGLGGWLISESADMQRQLRTLQGLPPALTWHTLMIALISVAIWLVILFLARTIRLGSSKLIHALGRLLPRPVALTIGLVLSAMVVTVGLRDVVFDRGVIDVADRIAKATNFGTKDGIEQPTSRLVSGGPGSLIAWQDLGFQGRNFAGSAPTGEQIAAYRGSPASDPIRIYISSPEPAAFSRREPFKAQAELAVRELKRTGAFDREVLVIAGTTGSGWIDPNVAESLEYMYGGDTAVVAVQYSYLPSWVSFLVDKEKAGESTRALVTAVRAEVDALPAQDRPKFAVTGESLGAYAIEDTFGSVDGLLGQVDAALLAGVPHFSPVSQELRSRRDPGSPVWRPQFEDGKNIRFAQFPEDLDRPPGTWGRPRVVYLQNASDPVVWWSTDLLFQRPEWMNQPLGPDVTPEINWFPFVAFWQTTVDMAVSYGVDAPHGHRYGAGSVNGWAAVLPPKGWTDQDTEQLRKHIDGRRAPY
ncbi:alpha/beta hydrolase [Streptomyces sp. E11-3]|uniref:alpha/beta hydrolase n=1 Tax=Streptomyces sp. E11-3 TaxID=3110112 RepID=UPI00397EC983